MSENNIADFNIVTITEQPQNELKEGVESICFVFIIVYYNIKN